MCVSAAVRQFISVFGNQLERNDALSAKIQHHNITHIVLLGICAIFASGKDLLPCIQNRTMPDGGVIDRTSDLNAGRLPEVQIIVLRLVNTGLYDVSRICGI